jgi:hypothetical protein
MATVRANLNWQGIDNAGLFLWVPHGRDGDIVTLVVAHTARDLAAEFHFRRVRFPDRILRAYLFIRFAISSMLNVPWDWKTLSPPSPNAALDRPNGSVETMAMRAVMDTMRTMGGSRANNRSRVVHGRKKRESRDGAAEGGLGAQKQKLLRT